MLAQMLSVYGMGVAGFAFHTCSHSWLLLTSLSLSCLYKMGAPMEFTQDWAVSSFHKTPESKKTDFENPT